MKHSDHNPGAMATAPTMSGQYAFATISEIVTILRANPLTDWSTVDLSKLQEHLVDMHNVTIEALVSSEPVDGGAIFEVTASSEEVIDSIQRMVSAHSAVMSSQSGAESNEFTYVQIHNGAQLTVKSKTKQGAMIIRALGFHGTMAEGDHHRHHHWMLATGQNPH